MISTAGRDTTRIRAEVAQANEQTVLAEQMLRSDLVLAWMRLGLFLLWGAAMNLAARVAGTGQSTTDQWGWVGIALYGLFVVSVLVALHWVKASLVRATYVPYLVMSADFGFSLFMTYRALVIDRTFNPELSVVSLTWALLLSVMRLRVAHIVTATLLACLCFLVIGAWRFPNASWFAVFFVAATYLAIGMLLIYVNRSIHRMFLGLRRRDNLSRFLPRAIVERLLSGGDAALQPTQREVTILFSDIRDFTQLSEKLPPQVVLRLLDDYFSQMSQIVMGRDGLLNKFLGDGLMALWNVPEPSPRHAELALRAALDMRRKLEELNAQRERLAQPPLRIGIGVHTGMVAAGMVGGADQHEYTVIGDAVNLASRVEGLTKGHRVDILVSEATWMLAGGKFAGRRLGEEAVKGRGEKVVIYALEGEMKPE